MSTFRVLSTQCLEDQLPIHAAIHRQLSMLIMLSRLHSARVLARRCLSWKRLECLVMLLYGYLHRLNLFAIENAEQESTNVVNRGNGWTRPKAAC